MTRPAALLILLLAAPTGGEPAPGRPGPAPTTVRLVADGLTLEEVVRSIDDAGPNRLDLAPEPPPDRVGLAFARPSTTVGPPRLYRLAEPSPVPFWAAVDRVARASGRWPVAERGVVVLRPSIPGAGAGFACQDGAFRVVLAQLAFSRTVRFAPAAPRDRPVDDGEFLAQLAVMVEPRFRLVAIEEVRLVEATDDRGRSLLLPDVSAQANTAPAPTGFNLPTSINARLRRPDDPGEVLKRLRGTVVVAVDGPGVSESERRAEVAFDFADVPMP